jgi:hypothetical protein
MTRHGYEYQLYVHYKNHDVVSSLSSLSMVCNSNFDFKKRKRL